MAKDGEAAVGLCENEQVWVLDWVTAKDMEPPPTEWMCVVD